MRVSPGVTYDVVPGVIPPIYSESIVTEPARFISGFTQDQKTQPLGSIGVPNPFWYAVDADDFMPYRAADYTVTVGDGGSVAATTGVGGNVLFTTGATLNDVAVIQRATPQFQLSATRKLAYLCRVTIATILPTVFRGGLINSGAPFGATDGIFFSKLAGNAFMSLLVMVGGVTTGSVDLPLAFGNAMNVDLGFEYEPGSQGLVVFCGQQIVGSSVDTYNTQTLGPQARLFPTAYPTAFLAPTLAIQAGAVATAVTMTADFQFAALERKNGG